MDNYYKSKKFQEVLKVYEEFLKGNTIGMLGTNDFSEIAQYYHECHDDEKALEAVDNALEIYPGSVAPLAFKSRYALLEEHDSDKADAIAEEIADKNDPDYILLKAEIMIVDGRADEADDYLEKAYQSFYDDDYYDDMPLDVATLFSDYEETDLSEKWLLRSDETDEDEYLDIKARIFMARNQLEKSKTIINQLINDDPYSTEYWNMMASAQMLADDFSNSVTSSDYALAIEPDNRDALLNKANGLLGLNNLKEAEKIFRQYMKLEPKRDTGYLMTAMTVMGQERYQEALTLFKKALEVNTAYPEQAWGDRAEILFQLAFIENYLEHFSKVHEYLDELANVYSDNLGQNLDELGRRLAEVDCAHGHVCLEENNPEKAADWFEQAVSDSDGNPKIFIKIAASAFECGYVNYAYDILHQVVYENGVDDEKGLRYLSSCCEILEKNDEKKWAQDRLDKIVTSEKKG